MARDLYEGGVGKDALTKWRCKPYSSLSHHRTVLLRTEKTGKLYSPIKGWRDLLKLPIRRFEKTRGL
jgi:hypothetical protein